MTSRCKPIIALRLKPIDQVSSEILKRRPPRVLVYEPIPPACQSPREPIYHAPGAALGVTIKVCNYSRMCQACKPPPLCNCKPRPLPPPPQTVIMRKTIKIIKASIFLVITKWLIDIGVFGDLRSAKIFWDNMADELREFFNTTRRCVQSDATKYDMARIQYNLKNVWNMMVESLLRSAMSMPAMLASIPGLIIPEKKIEDPKIVAERKKKEEQRVKEEKKKLEKAAEMKKKEAERKMKELKMKAEAKKKELEKKMAELKKKEEQRKKDAKKKKDDELKKIAEQKKMELKKKQEELKKAEQKKKEEEKKKKEEQKKKEQQKKKDEENKKAAEERKKKEALEKAKEPPPPCF